MRNINKKGDKPFDIVVWMVVLLVVGAIAITMANTYIAKKGGTAIGSSIEKAGTGLSALWEKLGLKIPSASAAENLPGEKASFEFGLEQKAEIAGPETYYLTISEPDENDAVTVTVKDANKKEIPGCGETSEWKFSAGKNDCCINENSGLCLKLIELAKDPETDDYIGANIQVYSKTKYPLPNSVRLDTNTNKGTNTVIFWFERSKYSIMLTKIVSQGSTEGAYMTVNKILGTGKETLVCNLRVFDYGDIKKCGNTGFDVYLSIYRLYTKKFLGIGGGTPPEGYAIISVFKSQ